MKRMIFIVIAIMLISSGCSAKDDSAYNVMKSLSEMTLEEKVGQMIQVERAGMSMSKIESLGIGSVLSGGGSVPGNGSFSAWNEMMTEYENASAGSSSGIPIIYGIDAVHGNNNVLAATIFPHNVGLGAANDPELLHKIGQATAEEIQVIGAHMNFAPVVSVIRDKRWGRTYEGYSEDPELVSKLGTSYIEGLREAGIIATAKHFIGDGDLEVMDYERATHIIRSAEHIGISMCYCRHKMEHVGKNCDAPIEICMTFGKTADSLIRSDYARRIDVDECMELLEVAYAHNLVQIGENVQNEVAFICNCCGCCCEALLAAQKYGTSQTIATTNFLPKIDHEKCKECGKCISVCPVSALGDKSNALGKTPVVQEDMCLGCGVCIRNCHFDALALEPVDQRRITPVNSAHRIVLMALDKGTLANLIYDNQSLVSHRILGALFTAILALPPAKQLAANEQLRSKYLANLMAKRTK